MIGFIIGVFVGVFVGVVIMALMAAAEGGDEEMMLFMTDQQVKHDGKMCEIDNLEQRLSACPLKELPTPHGRLIDADALLRVIEENSYRLRGVTNSTENGMFLTGIRQAINEAPTIIEAEVSKNA